MDRKQVVEDLVAYKLNNRLTDAQLSEMIGIPLSTINAWIRGARIPSLVSCAVISDFLSSHRLCQ